MSQFALHWGRGPVTDISRVSLWERTDHCREQAHEARAWAAGCTLGVQAAFIALAMYWELAREFESEGEDK
jgi:hypothetical protein